MLNGCLVCYVKLGIMSVVKVYVTELLRPLESAPHACPIAVDIANGYGIGSNGPN